MVNPTHTLDLGRGVWCDMCGENLTDDTRTGGFLFQSKGVGPCCAERLSTSIRSYGEERFIRGHCPEGVAFADWMRQLREQSPAGGTVRIYEGDAAMQQLDEMVAERA